MLVINVFKMSNYDSYNLSLFSHIFFISDNMKKNLIL